MTQLEIEVKNRYGISRGDDTQETSGIDMQRASDFLEGYRQAEKDLELTWEDIREICRMWIESKTPFGVTGEALYIEVLKRFKAQKGENNYHG